MKWILAMWLACSVPSVALAQAPDLGAAPAALPGEGPGNGAVVSLSVFSMNSLSGSIFGITSTETTSAFPSLAPLVSIGFGTNRVAAMVGFGFAAFGGSGGGFLGAGGSTGTTFLVSMTPTIRYYLTPLQAGGFSPFAEGTVGIAIAGSSPDIAFDLGGGFGGEWLFVKNFGLFGRATIIYEHVNTGPNVDGIGLVGDVGLVAHL